MSLITLLNAHIAFGERPLLDDAQLTVQAGERLGLIGRNGTGKSTLLGVLAGKTPLDDGELQRREGLRLGLVEQEPQLPAADTLQDSLLLRAKACAAWSDGVPADEREHWRLESRLEEFLHRFGLTGDLSPASCSGGERKRAALALALALQPDLLLLDEPTNHLDIEAIERLEELLLKVPAAIVITHDRAFLDRVTTRIIELDRGVLRSYPGSFAAYEQRKDEELAAEDTARRRFEKFWQQEEVWIRKGVEARRTRNEGRVRRLEQLRIERAMRRDRLGKIRLTLDAGERSGDLVAEFEQVSKRFAATRLIENLSMRIMRGDRIGLIGPNGAGKSTLIRLILGELAPDAGTVRLGTRLNIAYFDQLRAQLDPKRDPRRGHQSRFGLGADRQRAQAHRELPGRVPVPRAAREVTDQHALRRRAQPSPARAPVRATCKPRHTGRADQRSRHRIPGATRSSGCRTTRGRCCW